MKSRRIFRLSLGFTLVELLVVIGIIAVLIAVLLPALSAAKRAAEAVQCASNVRQLLIASFEYAHDNNSFWPPADLDFLTQNLDRWHGTRTATDAPFNFDNSRLKKYLRTDQMKQCPSFEPSTSGFEQSAGGYGYNNYYLGSSMGDPPAGTSTLPAVQWDEFVVDRPAKLSMIRQSSQKIAFADAAMATAPLALIEYSFVEPPVTEFGPNAPSIHFRHRGRANIGWADGHVTAMTMDWTYPTNIYGADNAKSNLGFVGPHDNSWFSR